MMKNIITGLFLTTFALTTSFAQSDKGHWQIVNTQNKIDGRSECSLVAVKGKLYLIGGDGPAEPVEVYDPANNSWSKKVTAPCVMHHLQAVALGTKIYVLDAFYEGGFPQQTPNPNVYCYDTQTDSWQKLAEIPADRRRAGAGEAVYNGKLYLVCGITHGHSSGTNAMFDEYDPATNTWKQLPDAPHIRDHSMAVVVGDKLYAVGGRNTSYRDPDNKIPFFRMVMLDVDVYDFKTGTWSTLNAKLPMGTGGGTAVNLNNKIYYIGGERATDTTQNGPQKDVFVFDPAQPAAWTRAASVNLARNGVGGTVLDHQIYIAGGAGGGPGGPPPGGMPGPPPNMGLQTGGAPPPGPPPGMRPGGGDIGLEVFRLK
jgi:N-acetylneuraminic acid mutarotase